ncbi:type II toxin-antitoxin system PemK/MazF family toxin [Cytobacillus firmus]|uniref:type II toxin-antitoxin system PemK/MazF family toxin n=1 Tax=Cytobacillus firmus TaxID=1399 RepID=UPI00237BAB93|nr:type II toxin-antitoxin system PemK/MazF family toxin [Cytobacillus firmus]MDD9309717.1 type II toxin-antitoxin system PemK/MazF family toxin [Cytobacillus firmus]
MPLTESTRKAVKSLFEETLDILEHIEVAPDAEDDENEEALKYADWTMTKAKLHYGTLDTDSDKLSKPANPKFPVIFGGIYWTYLGKNIGDEINKHRPVLVIRSEPKSNLCTVIPLSTQRMSDGLWYHIDLEKQDNTAIVEQMQVISKNRIEKPLRIKGNIAKASDEDLIKIIKEIRRYYTSPPKWFSEKYKEDLK